jgi:hypothetical protein
MQTYFHYIVQLVGASLTICIEALEWDTECQNAAMEPHSVINGSCRATRWFWAFTLCTVVITISHQTGHVTDGITRQLQSNVPRGFAINVICELVWILAKTCRGSHNHCNCSEKSDGSDTLGLSTGHYIAPHLWNTEPHYGVRRASLLSPVVNPLTPCPHKLRVFRKIWGFHGGDYGQCRLLGYKNPVRTSQETHLRYRAQPVNAM